MNRRIAVLAFSSVLCFVGTAPAQACGPLTFQFSDTGPGCVPFSGAPTPALSASMLPPGWGCHTVFSLAQGEFLFPLPVATLVLGANNPGFTTPLLPGCVLRATPDVMTFMTPDVVFSTQTFVLNLPRIPELAGITFYAQAIWPVEGELRFSNGVEVTIL